MVLQEIINKIREMKEQRLETARIRDEGGTTDGYLKSLRRERQLQLEEVEKIRLKKRIAGYKKDRMRELMYGMKKQITRKKLMGSTMKKAGKILQDGKSLLKSKSFMFGKSKL